MCDIVFDKHKSILLGQILLLTEMAIMTEMAITISRDNFARHDTTPKCPLLSTISWNMGEGIHLCNLDLVKT